MGAAGDLSLVDTVAMGELQFFMPGLNLELFDSSRSRRGTVGRWLAFAEGGEGSYSPKGMLETAERDGGSSW